MPPLSTAAFPFSFNANQRADHGFATRERSANNARKRPLAETFSSADTEPARKTTPQGRLPNGMRSVSSAELLSLENTLQRLESAPFNIDNMARFFAQWSESSHSLNTLAGDSSPNSAPDESHAEVPREDPKDVALAKALLEKSVNVPQANEIANLLLDVVVEQKSLASKAFNQLLDTMGNLSAAQRVVVFGFVRESLGQDSALLKRFDAFAQKTFSQLQSRGAPQGKNDGTNETPTTSRAAAASRASNSINKLGLDEGAPNTCYIHTGIQMLRKTLNAPALTRGKAQQAMTQLLNRKAAQIGVTPGQFTQLLRRDEPAQLELLRAYRGVTEASEKSRVTEEIVGRVLALQSIFGPQISQLTPAEKGIVLDEIERVASGQVVGDTARAALYRIENPHQMAAAVRQHLDAQTHYISGDENAALRTLQDFHATERKLEYLDAVLTIKDGTDLPAQDKRQLLSYLAENVNILGGAGPGEQGDAGEFSSKITELFNEFFPNEDTRAGQHQASAHEVIYTQYADVTPKMEQWARIGLGQTGFNTAKSQDLGNTIFLPLATNVSHLPPNNQNITLQHVINGRFAGEQHESREMGAIAGFEGARHLGLSKTLGLNTLPENLSIRVDRKSIDFTGGPPVARRDNRSFDLPSLNNLQLELPVYDQRHQQFNRETVAYDIIGFSVHHGGASGGHWTAFSKMENGQWYSLNDARVRAVSADEALSNACTASSFALQRA